MLLIFVHLKHVKMRILFYSEIIPCKGDISPWKNNQTLDKNTAQLMQTLKKDILKHFPQTNFPRQLKGGLNGVLGCVDVKLSASLKEILNENIPANDSDDSDDNRPLVTTKRAADRLTDSDDDATRSNEVLKKMKVEFTVTTTSTISDGGSCLIRPWLDEQKQKLGIGNGHFTPQLLQTIEETLKTDIKKLCPTVTFPPNQINIKKILDCIPETLFDAVVKGLCACNTEVAEELPTTPSKTKVNADMVTTGLHNVGNTEVTPLVNIIPPIQEMPIPSIQVTPEQQLHLFSKPATTVKTLNKQRQHQEGAKQTTMVLSPNTKAVRINRKPSTVTYIRI